MFENIIGKEYGKLKIVSFSRETKNGYIFNCLCNCGRKTTIECNLKKLEKGKVKDCGCVKRNKNLIGKKFGKLLVVSRNLEKQKDRNAMWNCECECGGKRIVMTNHLTNGLVKHCGCENEKCRNEFTKTKIHKIWCDMKYRVKYNKSYINKNIKICDEWLGKFGFINFYNWAINNGYKEEKGINGYNILTIDRIDNNKGYNPNNCRFVTILEQSFNKNNTVYVEYNGNKYNFLELEEIINKPRRFIYLKWKKGYSIEQIKKMSCNEIEKEKYKINYDEIYSKGYIPICDLQKRYKITEKRIRYFFEKQQIPTLKIKGKNCFEMKFLPIIEKKFNIKFECKTP